MQEKIKREIDQLIADIRDKNEGPPHSSPNEADIKKLGALHGALAGLEVEHPRQAWSEFKGFGDPTPESIDDLKYVYRHWRLETFRFQVMFNAFKDAYKSAAFFGSYFEPDEDEPVAVFYEHVDPDLVDSDDFE